MRRIPARFRVAPLAMMSLLAMAGAHLLAAWSPQLSPQPSVDSLHRPLDELLDLYVRDGLVYYRALKVDRPKLDRYVASLAGSSAGSASAAGSREEQVAFWLNAYDAFVLQTVIDHYPIRGRAAGYPAGSIRQIPGAFDRVRHRAAGRSVTLDEIETGLLGAFSDPRVFLALGRGAVGSGRLRSEAYVAARLEQQLAGTADEAAQSSRMVRIDQPQGQVSVSQIFAWRQEAFIATYAGNAMNLAGRTPIERAILGFVGPHLLQTERAFLEKNTFQLKYQDMDWHLNDLTGR